MTKRPRGYDDYDDDDGYYEYYESRRRRTLCFMMDDIFLSICGDFGWEDELECNLTDYIYKTLSSRESLKTECKRLANYALDVARTQRTSKLLEESKTLFKSFGTIFADKHILCYGSFMQGLEIEGYSDFDIYIGDAENFYHKDKPITYHEFVRNNSVQELIAALEKGLRQRPELFSNVCRPRGCNVRCTYKPNNIDCDFSFRSGISFTNSNFIRVMMNLDGRVRELALFLKMWAHETRIRYYLPGYISTLMVIFYLQTQKILPPVRDLQSGAPSRKIGVWECGIVQDIKWKTEDKRDVSDLVAGFFQFYNDFDFNNVICLYTGKTLPSGNVYNFAERCLPRDMCAQLSHINFEGYSPDVCIYVMGPFDFNNAAYHRMGSNQKMFDKFLGHLEETDNYIQEHWK